MSHYKLYSLTSRHLRSINACTLKVPSCVQFILIFSEAVVRRYSVKKVFLKFPKIHMGNTCARVSYLKRGSGTGVFLWIFKNTFFYKTTLVAASVFYMGYDQHFVLAILHSLVPSGIISIISNDNFDNIKRKGPAIDACGTHDSSLV